ncbi:hypothetical protein Pyn_21470 [Prunus yedoensis var. nudiflora]|uniref:NYN domain-containing protein n=1 Tax=Prunus yedoensis var. nudiflora TaxID=2094558 RepID=A0A314ULA9_PRUYE|nr:hypothetical protein Pyn_21470 [Prunus yedoensis var. nudiflora]
MMDHRRAECLMLMSDDSDFVDVVMEAKLRCLKTVVVGDFGDGALKRVAASGFSWNEILIGKAKKEAVLVVGKWKDRDVLKRLEWTYKPGEDQSVHSWDDEIDGESKEEEIEGIWSNDLEFLCSAWPDRLEVQKVYVLHHDRMPAKPYMGPDFGYVFCILFCFRY